MQGLLMYILLALLLLLTVCSELLRRDMYTRYLIVLTALICVLISVRHLYTTYTSETALQERERERWEAEQLRRLSAEFTSILDIELLLEHITIAATKDLGFEAALVLLREEQFYNMGPQPRLLVRTSAATTSVTKWRLQGQEYTFFYHLILEGNEVEMQLDTLTCDVPPEIQAWRIQHQIATLYFFPFVYQGVTLGCLGVANDPRRPVSARDIALASAYSEHVAVIVKHAQLYREACEHEAFARAMANIATRLNAAVAVPSEIHHLICMEGAGALQADYTIFYILGTQGQLEPLAAFDPSAEVQPLYSEWPPIKPYEDEAQIFYALQPILMHPQVAAEDANHIQRDNYVSSLSERLAYHNVDTAIVAPLVAAGEPVGLLVFGRAIPIGIADKQSFDKEALPLAQDFAEQAAVALMNANLYQHLHNTHQQMQQLDALKDQFMVTASHELRTPLTAVQGYIELLAQFDMILPTEQRHEFLQKARRSCDELVLMLGNVMDASRIEIDTGIQPALLERVDLLEVVESVLTLIEPHVQQEQRLVHVAIPPKMIVLVDPIRLRQVLMNIGVNALKYSLPHTPLYFSAHVCATATPAIVLSIADKGKGIMPQDQARLFQRFVRLESDVNSSVRGSGLGLYISRRLLESMGGKIWIESRGVAGEGSTFHIQLAVA